MSMIEKDLGSGLPPASNANLLERLFKLSARNTNVKTEILAGITSFMTMSYIIFVNPIILADAGIPKEAALAATIYASVFCTLLMALWANFPVAVAPGMGLNAFLPIQLYLVRVFPGKQRLVLYLYRGLCF